MLGNVCINCTNLENLKPVLSENKWFETFKKKKEALTLKKM